MVQDHFPAQEVDVDEAWITALEESGAEFVILDLECDCGLVKFLRAHPEWSVDFEGEGAVIFAH